LYYLYLSYSLFPFRTTDYDIPPRVFTLNLTILTYGYLNQGDTNGKEPMVPVSYGFWVLLNDSWVLHGKESEVVFVTIVQFKVSVFHFFLKSLPQTGQ
jgi:hypothetical protein